MTATARILAGLEAIIVRVTRRLDCCALYPAAVLAQRADGTLDLVPESTRVPSCTRVPYRTVRGLALVIPAGARVLLGYEDGDPSRPVALLWELGNATTITVNGGTANVNRAGDGVDRSSAMDTWMTAVQGALTAAGHTITPFAGSAIGTTTGGNSSFKA